MSVLDIYHFYVRHVLFFEQPRWVDVDGSLRSFKNHTLRLRLRSNNDSVDPFNRPGLEGQGQAIVKLGCHWEFHLLIIFYGMAKATRMWNMKTK